MLLFVPGSGLRSRAWQRHCSPFYRLPLWRKPQPAPERREPPQRPRRLRPRGPQGLALRQTSRRQKPRRRPPPWGPERRRVEPQEPERPDQPRQPQQAIPERLVPARSMSGARHLRRQPPRRAPADRLRQPRPQHRLQQHRPGSCARRRVRAERNHSSPAPIFHAHPEKVVSSGSTRSSEIPRQRRAHGFRHDRHVGVVRMVEADDNRRLREFELSNLRRRKREF